MEIRLLTLGHLRVFVDDEERTALVAGPRARAVLAYIALERSVDRDELLHVFWPDDEPGAARAALERTLDELRAALGGGWLEAAGERLRVAAVVDVDALAFERAVERGDLEDALRRYGGGFLEDADPPPTPASAAWSERTRDRLAALYRRARAARDRAGDPAFARDRDADAAGAPAAAEGAEPTGLFGMLRGLYQELYRRRVIRVAVSYAAVAFVIMQAADVLFPALNLPDWTLTLAAVLALLGFPLALILAWALEITPEGRLRREAPGLDGGMTPLARQGVLLGLLLLLAGGAWFIADRLAPGAPAEPAAAGLDPERIAVLYFDDHSEDRELDYLADGLTEALIHELTQVPALEVIPRNGVKPYRGTGMPDSVVRALGIGSLVEGSIARRGDSVRVIVQLIDPGTDTHLDSREFVHPWADRLTLEPRIAREASELLRRRLGEHIQLRERRAGTDDPAAWDLAQRATGRANDAEALEAAGELETAGRLLARADSLLDRAERRDRGWTEPTVRRGRLGLRRAALAEAAAVAGGGEAGEAVTEALRTAIAHADRALRRAPDLADALEVRGTASYRMWDLGLAADSAVADTLVERAETDLRAAIAGERPPARAHATLAMLLNRTGRFAEAKLMAERAYRADAFLENARDLLRILAQTSLDREEHRDALRWCEEGRRRYPADAVFPGCALNVLAWSDAVPPDPARAGELADAMVETSLPQFVEANRAVSRMLFGAVLARAGRPDSARAVIAAVRADTVAGGLGEILTYLEAGVRLRLGEIDRALGLLDAYLAARPQRRAYVAEDWLFRPLFDDPRFRALVRP